MRVPEFQAVNFRMVKKGGWIIGIKGGNDKQEELREMLEKAWEDRTRVGSGITLHVVGDEAREQVAEGDKEFLLQAHPAQGWFRNIRACEKHRQFRCFAIDMVDVKVSMEGGDVETYDVLVVRSAICELYRFQNWEEGLLLRY